MQAVKLCLLHFINQRFLRLFLCRPRNLFDTKREKDQYGFGEFLFIVLLFLFQRTIDLKLKLRSSCLIQSIVVNKRNIVNRTFPLFPLIDTTCHSINRGTDIFLLNLFRRYSKKSWNLTAFFWPYVGSCWPRTCTLNTSRRTPRLPLK